MGIKIKIHRGLQSKKKSEKPREKYEEVKFPGGKLQELINVLGLDSRIIGLVIINGRIACDFNSTKVEPDDIVEFYPPIMGG